MYAEGEGNVLCLPVMKCHSSSITDEYNARMTNDYRVKVVACVAINQIELRVGKLQ